MRFRVLALALALALALPIAGCVQKASTELGGRILARGEDPRMADAWSYDGAGLRNAVGSVTIDVNHRTNEGKVEATLDDGRDLWRLEWTEFVERAEFHSGGIAKDLVEHGNTTVGDKSVPEVTLLAAGWGEARLYRNGALVPDPFTGNETLRAHFMLVDGALRAEDGTIHNATGDRPYDPANAADGSVAPGGPQIFVTLSSHETAPPYRFFLVLEFPTVTIGEEREAGPIA